LITSLRPSQPILLDQWHWEFATRYSGATVPEFHGVPRLLTAIIAGLKPVVSKNTLYLLLLPAHAKKKMCD
jgi:hypothetical protein